MLSARWRATGGAVNTDGDTSHLVAYATAHAHSSVEKALRIAGIGTQAIRTIAHDADYAMRPDALAAAIAADRAAGRTPFFVCATRGTTSSLAFDPTAAISEICRDAGAWLHVDAAMAGIAALAPEYRWVNDGVEWADSYCTNPHKWMGINFDCDLYWTADRHALLGALSILPEYLRSAAGASGAAADLRDWQVPLGRRFRALKLWFGLRLDGIATYQSLDPPPRRPRPRARRVGRRRRPLRDRRSSPAQPRVPALCRRRGDGAAHRRRQRHAPCVVHAHGARRSAGAALLRRLTGDGAASRRRRLAAVAGARQPLSRRSRSTSTCAVAPHTVSSSSSKK